MQAFIATNMDASIAIVSSASLDKNASLGVALNMGMLKCVVIMNVSDASVTISDAKKIAATIAKSTVENPDKSLKYSLAISAAMMIELRERNVRIHSFKIVKV